jgi:23S rRNA (guanine745-N1)-methyltransferase
MTVTRTSESVPGPTRLATWLRCPRCGENLSPGGATWSLSCVRGHSFDANKRGYLNLVDRSRGILGDTDEILQSREAFLAAGHYSPIARLVSDALPRGEALSVLDSGCGTGYYLEHVLSSRPLWDALALDVSVAAVTRAVRETGAVGVVSDVWQPLPVRDARADVVLCVFAPRNAAEFDRVLAVDGVLVVVTPSAGHLRELREDGRMIGMQDDKIERLDAALHPLFAVEVRRSLEYTIGLTAAEAASLVAMGPTGHHERAARAQSAVDVTVGVDLTVYRRA